MCTGTPACVLLLTPAKQLIRAKLLPPAKPAQARVPVLHDIFRILSILEADNESRREPRAVLRCPEIMSHDIVALQNSPGQKRRDVHVDSPAERRREGHANQSIIVNISHPDQGMNEWRETSRHGNFRPCHEMQSPAICARRQAEMAIDVGRNPEPIRVLELCCNFNSIEVSGGRRAHSFKCITAE